MSQMIRISRQTRANWSIDAAVFLGGILASLSAIYFLYLPSGGYEGGQNPLYGINILFTRHAWEDIHTWGGILMIAAVVIHFAIHWRWVKMMSRRTVNAILGKSSKLSRGAQVNVIINLVVALSFLVAAVSGIYFLLAPSGGYQGGNNSGWDPIWIFSRTTWDLIHTWSGIVMIVAAMLHFWIHWRWVVNVTRKFFLSLWHRPQLAKENPVAAAN